LRSDLLATRVAAADAGGSVGLVAPADEGAVGAAADAAPRDDRDKIMMVARSPDLPEPTSSYDVAARRSLPLVLSHVAATRYVTPLREGGSLPGLMEADDLGTYVVKFVGAGQGRKSLIAEVISASLGRSLGLAVPDLVTVEVDPALAAGEPDQEVQDLLRASGGTNLGVDFLPGALDFDPTATPVDADLAGRVLWFDALIGNVDRSWRNPNLLSWHHTLQLIDHGAALTFHHSWAGVAASVTRPYDASDHALLGSRPDVAAADADLARLVTRDVLHGAVAEVPDEWLADEPGFEDAAAVRSAYVEQLSGRLAARDAWLPSLRTVAVGERSHGTEPHGARRRTGRPDWLVSGPGGAAR
jgi:HipA-like protein